MNPLFTYSLVEHSEIKRAWVFEGRRSFTSSHPRLRNTSTSSRRSACFLKPAEKDASKRSVAWQLQAEALSSRLRLPLKELIKRIKTIPTTILQRKKSYCRNILSPQIAKPLFSVDCSETMGVECGMIREQREACDWPALLISKTKEELAWIFFTFLLFQAVAIEWCFGQHLQVRLLSWQCSTACCQGHSGAEPSSIILLAGLQIHELPPFLRRMSTCCMQLRQKKGGFTEWRFWTLKVIFLLSCWWQGSHGILFDGHIRDGVRKYESTCFGAITAKRGFGQTDREWRFLMVSVVFCCCFGDGQFLVIMVLYVRCMYVTW